MVGFRFLLRLDSGLHVADVAEAPAAHHDDVNDAAPFVPEAEGRWAETWLSQFAKQPELLYRDGG